MYSRIKHYLHDRCDAALVLVVVLLQYDFYFIDYYMKRLAVINIQSTYKCEKLKAEKKTNKKQMAAINYMCKNVLNISSWGGNGMHFV